MYEKSTSQLMYEIPQVNSCMKIPQVNSNPQVNSYLEKPPSQLLYFYDYHEVNSYMSNPTGKVFPKLFSGIVNPKGCLGIVNPNGPLGIVNPKLSSGIVNPKVCSGIVNPNLPWGKVNPNVSSFTCCVLIILLMLKEATLYNCLLVHACLLSLLLH